jgi:hypothetical protein
MYFVRFSVQTATVSLCSMGVHPFYDKGPHTLLWTGSRAARRKTAITGTPNRLNRCDFYTTYIFTNVDAGRGLETHAIEHLLIRYYNREEQCLLRGTN